MICIFTEFVLAGGQGIWEIFIAQGFWRGQSNIDWLIPAR